MKELDVTILMASLELNTPEMCEFEVCRWVEFAVKY